MLNKTMFDTLYTTVHHLPEPALRNAYFFHDIRITCHTNHPAILAMLDEMLGIFPEPSKPRGEASYYVLCYEHASQFPVHLPHDRIRTDTIRLLTKTKLTWYRSRDYTTEYQSYAPLPGCNAAALTAISPDENLALTQLEMPEHYQARFLRRYVLLMALGELMHLYGFEPCHAAAITAPWNTQQGALIIGASGRGKTTLSLGCAITGCGFLGDDLVMLREDIMGGTISAYAITHEVSARPATIDLWQTLSFMSAFPVDHYNKRYCSIEQVRTGSAFLQTPVRLLLSPSLTTEPQSTVTPLSKASALQELVFQCVGKGNTYPETQERLFILLSTLAEQAPGYQLTLARGASDGPQIVHSLLGTVPHD